LASQLSGFHALLESSYQHYSKSAQDKEINKPKHLQRAAADFFNLSQMGPSYFAHTPGIVGGG
jgi:hypothetical protein